MKKVTSKDERDNEHDYGAAAAVTDTTAEAETMMISSAVEKTNAASSKPQTVVSEFGKTAGQSNTFSLSLSLPQEERPSGEREQRTTASSSGSPLKKKPPSAQDRPAVVVPGKAKNKTTARPIIKTTSQARTALSNVSRTKSSSSQEKDDGNDEDEFVVVSNTMPSSLFAINDPPSSTATRPPKSDASSQPSLPTPASSVSLMTDHDMEICQRLDEEYERALEEREIGYNARYDSVRQSAAGSIIFMVLYMTLGTVFFTQAAGWQVHEALFFSIYTITTVGYGSDKNIPRTPGFQIYTIFYIFVGIATLTIMVAQVYQCIALEASRAQHRRDRAELAGRSQDLWNDNEDNRFRRDGIMKTSSIHDNDHRSSEGSSGLRRKSSTREHTRMEWGWGNSNNNSGGGSNDNITMGRGETWVDKCIRIYERTKHFLRDTQSGRAVSSLLPFGGLILIGAIVVGPIEGWTVVESLYFACVSLTTVGYGDTIPTRLASIWFCIFWLPFSVGFMSLYLTNVARFYIRLSDTNIQRLERQMRRRLQTAKQEAEIERAAVLRRAYRLQQHDGGPGAAASEVAMGAATDDDDDDGESLGSSEAEDFSPRQTGGGARASRSKSLANRVASQFGFEPLAAQDVNGLDTSEQDLPMDSPEALEVLGQQRRERILQESNFAFDGNPRVGDSLTTMGDILRTVREHVVTESDVGQSYGDTNHSIRGRPESQFMSIKSNDLMSRATVRQRPLAKSEKKPSFALRVLVQERFAEIIATEVAGFQSNLELQENTLSVTIDTLRRTVDKWLVPRRAQKAFRAVAFEAIYFVGEHSLITRGANALYDLGPFEFHGLFAPLLAALGDAETMEGWLASTNVLADVDLQRYGESRKRSETRKKAAAARVQRSGSDSGAPDAQSVARRRSIT